MRRKCLIGVVVTLVYKPQFFGQNGQALQHPWRDVGQACHLSSSH